MNKNHMSFAKKYKNRYQILIGFDETWLHSGKSLELKKGDLVDMCISRPKSVKETHVPPLCLTDSK